MFPVKLPLDRLIKATAVSKMKRAPKGAKSFTSNQTIIEFHPSFLIVDAPTHSTHIDCNPGFRATAKINSIQLHSTLSKLPKSDFVEFEFLKDENKLVINSDKTKIVIKLE